MDLKKIILSAAALACASGAMASENADCIFKDGDSIAFLGDSITEQGAKEPDGYVNMVMETLKSEGFDVTCVPAGISGNMSKHMLARVDKDVIAKKPAWMFLSCGVNDAPNGIDNPGVPLADYIRDINAILDKCAAAQIKVIILSATPVVEEPEHVANKNLVEYNNALRAIAAERRLPLIDLNKTFNNIIEKKKDKSVRYLTKDGTHMNPRGNAVIAAQILKFCFHDNPGVMQRVSEKLTKTVYPWEPKMNLKLSIADMEILEGKKPVNMKMDEWINTILRMYVDQQKIMEDK